MKAKLRIQNFAKQEHVMTLSVSQMCISNIYICADDQVVHKELCLKQNNIQFNRQLCIGLLKRICFGNFRNFPDIISNGVFFPIKLEV